MATNFCRADVYFQVACSGAWNPITGRSAVAVAGGAVAIGEAYIFDSPHPVLVDGKHGPHTVTARILYTETAGETTELVQAVYEADCDRAACLRWIPLGTTAGNKRYTTVSGILISPVYPQGDAGVPDPTMVEIVITCSDITVDRVV